MKEIRTRSFATSAFSIALFCFLFYTTLCTEDAVSKVKTPTKEETMQYKRQCTDNISNLKSISKNKNKQEIVTTHAIKEQTINEKDVFYIFLHSECNYIECLNEQQQLYWAGSPTSISILSTEMQKKKIIWIYFVQEPNVHYEQSEKMQKTLETINLSQNTVIEAITQYEKDLYIANFLLETFYVHRLTKLYMVWSYMQSWQSDADPIIILYNPIEPDKPSTLCSKYQKTHISYAMDFFIEKRTMFKKAFVLIGFYDKLKIYPKSSIYILEQRISSFIEEKLNRLYNLMKYRLRCFLKKSAKNSPYVWVRVNIIDSLCWSDLKKHFLTNVFLPESQSLDSNPIEKIERIDKTPIYFIYAGSQDTYIKNVPFDLFLISAHPMIAYMYANILNHDIPSNQYFIRNYSPIYVDFSFCVLNSLHRDCFQHFFRRTEYLLIRDIDCKHLYSFLKEEKMSKIFSYIAEAPQKTQILYQASTDPLKVDTTDSNLKNFCPKITDSNTVYYITKHMIFMKSTLEIKTRTEYQKYMVFDVLISKKEIQPDTLIIEERIRTIAKKKIREKGLINELKKSKSNSTAPIYNIFNTSKTAADHVIVVDRYYSNTKSLVNTVKNSNKSSCSTKTNVATPSTSQKKQRKRVIGASSSTKGNIKNLKKLKLSSNDAPSAINSKCFSSGDNIDAECFSSGDNINVECHSSGDEEDFEHCQPITRASTNFSFFNIPDTDPIQPAVSSQKETLSNNNQCLEDVVESELVPHMPRFSHAASCMTSPKQFTTPPSTGLRFRHDGQLAE
ncbi:hypothetical protein NEFER03_0654 [Nematocida sp. LUAm3]|nr:hypothetical protein NEFER03_0654 [Nematocida sp. LUAm3]KAI5175113.1 hypothetical protein NEFER02_1074 [Nematocida sp. LUAm2]KAI5179433.1 hypothetical protein NEFER01_2249 [Nematocida sp. LUAm1]